MVAQDGLRNKHLLILYVLKMFGLDASMDTFEIRLRKQKLLAWLKGEGINFGYDFSWYVKGPYSPALAADLFTLAGKAAEADVQLEARAIDPALKRQLDAKVAALGEHIESKDDMEAIGSIGYYKSRGFTKEQIANMIKLRKPALANRIDIDELVEKFG